MFRRFLPVLLAFSWISLSGLDVLEDLELPSPVALQAPDAPTLPNNGFLGRLANNIVETAEETHARWWPQTGHGSVAGTHELAFAIRKNLKLHKLYHVFLI